MSKNKNINHRVKKFVNISYTLTRPPTVFARDLTMSSTRILLFLMYFNVVWKNKDHIRRYVKLVLLFWFAEN